MGGYKEKAINNNKMAVLRKGKGLIAQIPEPSKYEPLTRQSFEEMMEILEKQSYKTSRVRNRDKQTGRFIKGYMQYPQYVAYGYGSGFMDLFDEAMKKLATGTENDK